VIFRNSENVTLKVLGTFNGTVLKNGAMNIPSFVFVILILGWWTPSMLLPRLRLLMERLLGTV